MTKDDAIKAIEAIEAVLLFHDTGGHEGDGTDAAIWQARRSLEDLRVAVLPPPQEKA